MTELQLPPEVLRHAVTFLVPAPDARTIKLHLPFDLEGLPRTIARLQHYHGFKKAPENMQRALAPLVLVSAQFREIIFVEARVMS